ncbi:hypothetical protein BT96DRAFT_49551 [Gymnopus androsaceus JB14]|uniref:Uncharacterized protein n=1 Tax=Gymnopus androsaceus JB14 TaxID=1447944 RepID=A0A6A4GDG0_9AGAR|nr:hypothetical protein BT96DRAFT_49551 [Gymnopus androsaceus JB14]
MLCPLPAHCHHLHHSSTAYLGLQIVQQLESKGSLLTITLRLSRSQQLQGKKSDQIRIQSMAEELPAPCNNGRWLIDDLLYNKPTADAKPHSASETSPPPTKLETTDNFRIRTSRRRFSRFRLRLPLSCSAADNETRATVCYLLGQASDTETPIIISSFSSLED